MGNRPCKACKSVTWFWNDDGRCNQCEERLKMNVEVLDHGYVKFVESWGSDARIVEAARMSTDKGFKGWGHPEWNCHLCGYTLGAELFTASTLVDRPKCPNCPACVMSYRENAGDEKLLKYLYDHKHMTPFEMAGMVVEVQAPIFVFREWHRHRTQSYNELSSRYTELPNTFYAPSDERLMMAKQSTTNKQSSEAATFTQKEIDELKRGIRMTYEYARDSYEGLLARGVAREVARVVIPVAQYSRMRASANLRNWLQFLTLRMDPAAQWEIRQYANAVAEMIAEKFPRTYELFATKQ